MMVSYLVRTDIFYSKEEAFKFFFKIVGDEKIAVDPKVWFNYYKNRDVIGYVVKGSNQTGYFTSVSTKFPNL